MTSVPRRGPQIRDLALVALIAAVAYLLGRSSAPAPLLADTVSENRDLVAVTGQYGSGTSILYLVDTKTKALLVYEARGGSQSDLRFVAARDIRYDFKVRAYNDASEAKMKVTELERQWRRFQGKNGNSDRIPANTVTPKPNASKPGKESGGIGAPVKGDQPKRD